MKRKGISEAAGCECVSLKHATKIKLADYDTIVFGSWFMAGGITKLPKYRLLLSRLCFVCKMPAIERTD